MSKPYRLSTGGRFVDRGKKISFTFDGKTVTGFQGDTVASAVLASGQRVFGRSFKYHRPRGLVGLGSEEMNALIGVGQGARHEPNLRATQIEIFNGMAAVSQNRWPSLNWDIGAINNEVSRFLPGGFYYKTFMWPQSFWKHVYEPFIRRAAGLGKAPEGRDPDTYEQIHVHCDVLVIGGGVAGLAAAEAAAANGAKVIIADENPHLGGLADISGGTIDGQSLPDWSAATGAKLYAAENVHVLNRTTVVGHWHHNFVMLFERVADHDPALLSQGVPRHRLWKVRAHQVILATGSIAGVLTKDLFLPIRRTAIYQWHVDHGAVFEPVGQWRRAYTYPKAGETNHQSIDREILAVRNKVGLLDASTLGKIEIKGPGAAEFLDRMYTNMFSTLKIGKCRYGLMMNELGFLTDDGVTVRLGDDQFLMHTTSGGADRISAWLEEWLQTEWTHYKVFVTNVTENWSQFAIAGPKAREVLQKLDPSFDISHEALPHMSFVEGRLGAYPVRVYRISFSGELSYEVATPSNYGLGLWKDIVAAGAEFGLEPYGTEALHVLRAEKGYIVVGDETDGTTTPIDVGLDGLVSRKKADFLGKRSLEQAYLKAPNRKQLVGLLTEDPNDVLPDGAYAVRHVKDKPPMEMIGQVTSSYKSPTLGRSIAMALIENGRNRMGETISFPLPGGKVVRAKITDTVFYDKEGAKLDV